MASSSERLAKYLETKIKGLSLDDFAKDYLKTRWLEELITTQKRARYAERRFYRLRLFVIISGLVVAALASLNVNELGTSTINIGGSSFIISWALVVKWSIFFITLALAITNAVNELYKFNDRWQIYARAAAMLEMEGWRFLRNIPQDEEERKRAFSQFADTIDTILNQRTEAYMNELVPEDAEPNNPTQQPPKNP